LLSTGTGVWLLTAGLDGAVDAGTVADGSAAGLETEAEADGAAADGEPEDPLDPLQAVAPTAIATHRESRMPGRTAGPMTGGGVLMPHSLGLRR
jgi:hypothetical protein